MLKRTVLILLIAFIGLVSADNANIRSDFAFKYSRIVYLIKQESWKELKEYESENTKCGFGPGEYGYGCVERMISSNSECKQELLFALNQGCRFVEQEGGAICMAPPQHSDPDILMPLNSRASLIYEKETSTVKIRSMICGGD